MTTSPELAAALVAASKIPAANQAVAASFIQRDDVALAFWLALVADRASFLLGPPGVAKTAVTQFLSGLVSDLKFYEELMPTVVSPEQLLVSETEILETQAQGGGKSIRVKNKMGNAADAHLVFLDEIWKTQPAVAKVLFDLLMADGIRLGGQFFQTPTLGVVTASNELAEPGNQLEALWSRMAFRFLVKPLDRAGKMRMLQSRLAQGMNGGAKKHNPVMNLADVEALQAGRSQVQIPTDIFEAVLKIAYEDLWEKNKEGFAWLVSDDRRFDVIREGLQAHALIHGRGVVAKADLSVLRYMLWDTPEQIPTVEAAIAPYCRTPLSEARQIVDELLAAGGNLHLFAEGNTGKVTNAVKAVDAAKDALGALAAGAGVDGSVIRKWIAELTSVSGEVAMGAMDPSKRKPWSDITARFRS